MSFSRYIPSNSFNSLQFVIFWMLCFFRNIIKITQFKTDRVDNGRFALDTTYSKDIFNSPLIFHLFIRVLNLLFHFLCTTLICQRLYSKVITHIRIVLIAKFCINICNNSTICIGLVELFEKNIWYTFESYHLCSFYTQLH